MMITFDTVIEQDFNDKDIKQLIVSVQREKGLSSEELKGFPLEYLFMNKGSETHGKTTYIPSLIDAMKYNYNCPYGYHRCKRYYVEAGSTTKQINDKKQEIIDTINDRIDEYKKLINTKLPKPHHITVERKVGLRGVSLSLTTI